MIVKTSELLEEFIQLLAEGEPSEGAWVSITENSRRRNEYYERLADLRREIDRRMPTQPAEGE